MRTIRGRLFLSLIVVMCFSVIVTLYLSTKLLDGIIFDQAKNQLRIQMEKAIEVLDGGDVSDLDYRDMELRFKDRMFYADYFLMDGNSKIVASSDPAMLGRIVGESPRKKEGIMVINGRKLMYTVQAVTDSHLRIMLYTSLESLKEIRGKLVWLSILALVLSSLVILTVGLLFMWKTTRPLKKLQQAVSQYEPYKDPHMFPPSGNSEIGDLIHTFQSMAERIRKHHDDQIEFLHHVSHELRTPLMSIQGYALAIKDQVVTQEQGLEVMTKESRRLIRMVDRLLQLTRLESTRDAWSESLLDLRDMTEQTVQLLSPLAADKAVSLTWEAAPYETYVPAEQLFQVMVNLVQNAIRHARSQVHISVDAGPKGWSFIVEDDGEGVAEEERLRIFDRFYKGKNGETGLGLTICRQIADRIGAEVICGVSPLGGARFTFRRIAP